MLLGGALIAMYIGLTVARGPAVNHPFNIPQVGSKWFQFGPNLALACGGPWAGGRGARGPGARGHGAGGRGHGGRGPGVPGPAGGPEVRPNIARNMSV